MRDSAKALRDIPEQEFWVHCGDCHHSWVAFYTPIRLEYVTRFGKICCPKCASKRVLCGADQEKRLT